MSWYDTDILPRKMDYSWFYRSDGKGTFRTGDPAVSSGVVSNASKISFATFSIAWSGNGAGKGWVYFSLSPTQLGKSSDYALYVTTVGCFSFLTLSARSSESPISLRVLYVGHRPAEFEPHLKPHFAKVESIAREGFQPQSARDFDVVLLAAK